MDLECVEMSFNLLHVLLLLQGGKESTSRALILQGEDAFDLISE